MYQKVCFHINKMTYTKKDLLINANSKYPQQITTVNSCGKFSRQIATANFHSKFLRKILLAISHGKFPWQIPAANSHGKLSHQIPTAISQICKAEDGLKYPLCGRASHLKMKQPRRIVAQNSHGKFLNV